MAKGLTTHSSRCNNYYNPLPNVQGIKKRALEAEVAKKIKDYDIDSPGDKNYTVQSIIEHFKKDGFKVFENRGYEQLFECPISQEQIENAFLWNKRSYDKQSLLRYKESCFPNGMPGINDPKTRESEPLRMGARKDGYMQLFLKLRKLNCSKIDEEGRMSPSTDYIYPSYNYLKIVGQDCSPYNHPNSVDLGALKAEVAKKINDIDHDSFGATNNTVQNIINQFKKDGFKVFENSDETYHLHVDYSSSICSFTCFNS